MGGLGGSAPQQIELEPHPRSPRVEISLRVELRGIEPLTYSMRTSRATNCATAPGASYRLDRNATQSLSAGHWPAA